MDGEMIALTSSTTMQSLVQIVTSNRTTHVGVRRQRRVLRFCVTLTQFDGVGNV